RSDFNDTGMSRYNDNTAGALDKVGWSIHDYSLAKSWFMHNEEVYNPNLIHTFLELNKGEAASLFSYAKSITYFSNEVFQKYVILVLVGFLSIIFIRKEEYGYSVSDIKKGRMLSILGIGIILFGIAAISGIRFPMRISMPLLIFLFMF